MEREIGFYWVETVLGYTTVSFYDGNVWRLTGNGYRWYEKDFVKICETKIQVPTL